MTLLAPPAGDLRPRQWKEWPGLGWGRKWRRGGGRPLRVINGIHWCALRARALPLWGFAGGLELGTETEVEAEAETAPAGQECILLNGELAVVSRRTRIKWHGKLLFVGQRGFTSERTMKLSISVSGHHFIGSLMRVSVRLCFHLLSRCALYALYLLRA